MVNVASFNAIARYFHSVPSHLLLTRGYDSHLAKYTTSIWLNNSPLPLH
jgi:hypothetical protein